MFFARANRDPVLDTISKGDAEIDALREGRVNPTLENS